jgi:hypothetical protein
MFLSTAELQQHIPIENLPTEYGGTSGFTFNYAPPADRNGTLLYERGWEPEVDAQKIQDQVKANSEAQLADTTTTTTTTETS